MAASVETLKARWQVLFGASGVYLLDAVSKRLVTEWIPVGQSVPLVPGVFQLTHMENTGAAFSLFYQHPKALTVVSGLLFLGFIASVLLKDTLRTREVLGFSFILGGAFGNLADRMTQGAVTDFIDFTLIRYPVFNIADSFIFVGVVLLLLDYVKHIHLSARS